MTELPCVSTHRDRGVTAPTTLLSMTDANGLTAVTTAPWVPLVALSVG
jgi:hypothetical protein